ncbi:MAG: 30S ribosomal protein S30e [Candidatus Bathyarchaeota archaeon]|nr:30S ribosomal protein S30e [Candidatus Bathyarchaeota archaeon]
MPTHGSLTKAGKVRAQTPKVEGIVRKQLPPRRKNRSNYKKRVLAAPDPFSQRGGRRRRRR